jgi:hypothetical protein
MHLVVRTVLASFGQSDDVAVVRVYATASVSVHQAVVRISDDEVVVQFVQMFRNAFTLYRDLDEDFAYENSSQTPRGSARLLALQ